MRRVEKVDQGGIKYVEWVGAMRDKNNPALGQRSFIEDFKGQAFRAKIRNPDSSPEWFRSNARVSQGAVGYDQTPWQSAFQKWQTSQGYLG
jgi:hypothetical protein